MSESAPSAAGQVVALADQCVQCGLCLPACPTYSLERIEAQSPRGRIALSRAWALDLVPPTRTGDTHLDQCLGCRRCEAVCPAGVQYGPLLVETRAQQRQRRPISWRQRALEWLAARPVRMGRLLGLYRLAYRWLPGGLRPLPRPPAPGHPPTQPPGPTGAAGMGVGVALFTGCVARPYEAALRQAVGRLCQALGIPVVEAAGQGCCGTLHAHAGAQATADRLASVNREAFAASTQVLTLASGCHEAVAGALAGQAPVDDAISFLARHGRGLRFRPCEERVALHLPCTQRNVVRSDAATRTLLARVPGLQVVDLDAGHGCCGAAGTHMLDEPARAAVFRAPLLAQLQASGATRVLSANIGCRLHLANGCDLPVEHPLQFLAAQLDPSATLAAVD